MLKAKVETLPSGDSHYSFKHWSVGAEEPTQWMVENREAGSTDRQSGSLIVVPHNSDITIHRVQVLPLECPTAD